MTFYIERAYPKSGTRDSWVLVGPETRDPFLGETRDPKSGIRDPGPLFYMGTKTRNQETERRIWDTYERWDQDPKQTPFVKPGAQELGFKWT